MIAGTEHGVYLETNRSWSIDDRRLNFQFGTQNGWEIRDGKRLAWSRTRSMRGGPLSSGGPATPSPAPPNGGRGASSTAARAAGPGHPRRPWRRALPLPQCVGDGGLVISPASRDDLLALADSILERVGGTAPR